MRTKLSERAKDLSVCSLNRSGQQRRNILKWVRGLAEENQPTMQQWTNTSHAAGRPQDVTAKRGLDEAFASSRRFGP